MTDEKGEKRKRGVMVWPSKSLRPEIMPKKKINLGFGSGLHLSDPHPSPSAPLKLPGRKLRTNCAFC